ncbi:MAG: adenylate/guanylate cyclase with integral rane sensor [Solirubrobacteraceae bacterium]|nr:adenylate/guanylate cyclase with integral rane sensor [Solirubrobacteraceae bacterium]
MERSPLRWLYRKLGPRYPRLMLVLQYQFAHLVALGGVGLLRLYQRMPNGEFLRILAVSEALVLVDNAFSLRATFCLIQPADPWLRGRRTPETAVAAWRALAGLPLDFLKALRFAWIVVSILPISIYIYFELGRPGITTLAILLAGTAIVLMYGVFLRFFMTELILHPVVAEIADDLPDGAELGKRTVPLKWRLLAALPAINIITGVTVAGLSGGSHQSLENLGINVLIAIAVAFTISFELSVLLSRTILQPLGHLRRGTERVAAGDLSVRVPMTGTDEAGRLAGSFNQMMSGLQERQALQDAFGAFVDPHVVDRVLAEGTFLQGEEVEVTVMFLDIRSFTAFAERSSAREVVARLNDFYDLIVPVLRRHGGHANKFIGDGLLGVFGAPDRLEDHADQAVAAALEIAPLVRRRYGEELRIGIGINSGPVVAGTVGGGGHVEFTVIGDPVNTAARVEEVTRQTGDDILITEATRCLLGADAPECEERPMVGLKGKTEQVRLWAPIVPGITSVVSATAAERRSPA